MKNLKNLMFYPQANEWMWHYCIFLGKFKGKDGGEYDLGIYTRKDTNSVSAAIVYSDKAGNYLSGELNEFAQVDDGTEHYEIYEETRKRAENIGLFIR